MFAAVMPGMGRLVSREIEQLDGIKVTDYGFDGRSDVVLIEVDRGRRKQLWDIRTFEDLFVEVGRTLRADGDKAQWIAGRIWRPERVQRALSIWSEEVRPLAGSMTFRVIARVLQERSFLRTDLRRQMTQAITKDKPKWRFTDPSQLEIWVTEYARGRFVAGIRLSDISMRQHTGREAERPGALRPTVAAAMVAFAGEAKGLLIDPCCGSGTILGEALEVGWGAAGRDIDPTAVEISSRNVPEAATEVGDARSLDFPDGSVDACVSNLPFGQQYGVQGEMKNWLTAVLGEMARVTRPGGRIVLLAPEIPRSAFPEQLRMKDKHLIRLLGTKTVLWVFDRKHSAQVL